MIGLTTGFLFGCLMSVAVIGLGCSSNFEVRDLASNNGQEGFPRTPPSPPIPPVTNGQFEVVLTSPRPMSRATDNVTLTADSSAKDGGTPQVAFLIDGKEVGRAPKPPYKVIWDASGTPEGRHKITARAHYNNTVLDSEMEVVVIPRSRYKGPYPPSALVSSIQFDWNSHRRMAQGADNFPVTWCEDDHQYTSWGDGWGFAKTGGKYSLGFARIEGGQNNYVGKDIVGGSAGGSDLNGKSYGVICIEGKFYKWVSPGSGKDGFREQRLFTSTNKGRNWSRNNWAFSRNEGLVHPTFVQFGKNYAGARDSYVYIYANHIKDAGGLKVQKPGEIALLRVPKDKITDRGSYRFFSGLNNQGQAQWTNVLGQRQAVFKDTQGVGWNTSVSYNQGLKRYLLMTEHTETFKGYLGIFEAPEPWGPWSTIVYQRFTGVPNTAFFWNFSNKWLSQDGSEFTMIFTGIGANDSWNTVKGSMTLY